MVADRRCWRSRSTALLFGRLRATRQRHHHGDGELRRLAGAAQPARIHLHRRSRAYFSRRHPDRHAARRRHPRRRPTRCCRSALAAVLVVADASAADPHHDRPLDARGQPRTRSSPASSASTSRAVIRATWLLGGGARLRGRHHASGITRADPAAYGLRPAAAAVRRRHPRRHRQRARRRCSAG